MRAWNDWYHVNGNTYGTWLRGDPRGWRARDHREHVIGDYKNPPPKGMYEDLYRRSKHLMSRKPVHLAPDARTLVCGVFVQALQFHKIEVIAFSVDDHHFHLLARFPEPSRPADCERGTPAEKPRDLNPWACSGDDLPSRRRRCTRKDGNLLIENIRKLVGIAKKTSARALLDAGLVEPRGVWAVRDRALPIKDRPIR